MKNGVKNIEAAAYNSVHTVTTSGDRYDKTLKSPLITLQLEPKNLHQVELKNQLQFRYATFDSLDCMPGACLTIGINDYTDYKTKKQF